MQSFYSQFAGHFGAVSRSGLTAIGTASALAGLSELVYMMHENQLMLVDFVLFSFVIAAHLSASYVAAMAMLSAPMSIGSYFRFLRGSAFLWGALVMGVVLFLIAPQGANRDAFLTNGIILALIGLLVLMMLPALPIAEALHQRIRPWALLKATKGHRFALVGLFMASGSLDKLVPNLSIVSGFLTIAGVLVCNFIINAATNLFYTALAVTSWQFAATGLGQSVAGDR